MLTLELLRQSSLRVEEFARHFLARLEAAVASETVAQSRARLQRLDYAQLLAEAERAKVSAEERVAYLRKLQQKQEQLLSRRGKW
jgi:Flp pilus assembly protein TadD